MRGRATSPKVFIRPAMANIWGHGGGGDDDDDDDDGHHNNKRWWVVVGVAL